MLPRKPIISILMPVFNGAEFLHRSIGSILKQTFTDWQLIVLNDGSTDESTSILNGFQQEDRRISVLFKENDGKGYVAANLSVMYPYATGEYFFYMSQDDELSPDCLEKLASRAIETDADIVIPDMLVSNTDGSIGTWPCSYPPNDNHSTILTGEEAFYLATDFSINGFALIRNHLMTDKRCDTQYFNSDEYNTRLQYLWANRIAFANGTFYYNLGNAKAVTARFSAGRFESLRTALMLEKQFNEIFTTKERRLKAKRLLFGTYVAMLILYCNNLPKMSDCDKETILSHIKYFETNVSFKGYRCGLFRHCHFHERIFAICLFGFHSRQMACSVYRVWHYAKQSLLNRHDKQ